MLLFDKALLYHFLQQLVKSFPEEFLGGVSVAERARSSSQVSVP